MLTAILKDRNFQIVAENLEVKRSNNALACKTVSGYGSRLPSDFMIRYNNKWRRVYVAIYSNAGTMYIGKNLQSGLFVDIDTI